MKIILISPCFNAEDNIENLTKSVLNQSDERWEHILIDDISEDNTSGKIIGLPSSDKRFKPVINSDKKFALRNIIEAAREYQDQEDVIIGIIDGDDALCNNNTIDLVLSEYEKGSDVVWTGHKWDINGINISKSMPSNVDPYQWQWSSSHFRTFRASLLKDISDKNFKDFDNNWFERGYDQALMLPLLSVTTNRKYIDKICYRYNIDSVSVNDRDWAEKKQLSTINLVRARGFLD
jgi:glycosyltransferase involved in cell wall biosynthesis